MGKYDDSMWALRNIIDQYKRDAEKLINSLEGIEEEISRIDNIIPKEFTFGLHDIKAQIKLIIEKNLLLLNQKQYNPSETVNVEEVDGYIDEANRVICVINNIIEENNTIVRNKESSQKKFRENLWSCLAYCVKEDLFEYKKAHKEIRRQIENIKKIINSATKTRETYIYEIREFRKRIVSTSAAIDSINQTIKQIGFQGFYIRERTGFKDTYEMVRDDGSIVKKLSDGEKNFIAFMYFREQVLGDVSSNFKNKIVVIDDPVTGLDQDSFIYVEKMIALMIDECINAEKHDYAGIGKLIKQMFILSHDKFFYDAIEQYKDNRTIDINRYLIEKSNNISSVTLVK